MTTTPPDLVVFTAGDSPGVDLTRASCEAVGIDLQVLDGRWTDFVDIKIKRARRFLETRTETVAMWIDGHDTLAIHGPEEILRRFGRMCSPIVLAAERNCFPDADRAEDYPRASGPRFLNAGCWIGLRRALADALDQIERTAQTGDDQREWTRSFLVDVDRDTGRSYIGGWGVRLDHGRSLFACMGDGPEALDADACILHYNGRCTGREEWWEKWGG